MIYLAILIFTTAQFALGARTILKEHAEEKRKQAADARCRANRKKLGLPW